MAHFTAAAPHAATWFWGTGKMIDGWLALMVLVAVLVLFKFLPLGRKSEPVCHSPMTALAETIRRSCLDVGLGIFLSGNLPDLPRRNTPRPGTALSARVAGRRCASSNRRFANAAACPIPAISPRRLNARTAAKWNCISAPRARRWSRSDVVREVDPSLQIPARAVVRAVPRRSVLARSPARLARAAIGISSCPFHCIR